MTKVEAFKQFKSDVIPLLTYTDKVAMREAWNDWTDYLYKCGDITSHQYDTWSNPF